jgi:glucose-1-phosphatase
MQRAQPIRVLVFDLAGVLLDFRGVESVRDLSGGLVDSHAFGQFWSRSPWADRLYRGVCSPEDFARGAVHELALPVAPSALLAAFRRWLKGPYPGAFELLSDLRTQFRLACLSNTNELDVKRFRDELRLHERFDECFFSNEIGRRKPNRDCYDLVVERLGTLPGEIAFFDDSAECVMGAVDAGLLARRCEGVGAIRRALAELQIWPESNRATTPAGL